MCLIYFPSKYIINLLNYNIINLVHLIQAKSKIKTYKIGILEFFKLFINIFWIVL